MALATAALNAMELKNAEGYLRRVHVVVGTVDERDFHAHHRVTRQDAVFHGFLNTLVDRGDVILGDDATRDLLDELVTLARAGRLDVDDHMAKLAAATGLADELAHDLLHRLADRLTVGDLRLADIGVHLELAQQPVDDDLQVQLAHAGDDGLAGLLIGANLKSRIFLGQLMQRSAQLFLVGLGLGLNGNGDNRLREIHGLENDRVRGVAEGVTGGSEFQSYRGGEIAGVNRVAVLAGVGVHLQGCGRPAPSCPCWRYKHGCRT